jgi:hypothetical protein
MIMDGVMAKDTSAVDLIKEIDESQQKGQNRPNRFHTSKSTGAQNTRAELPVPGNRVRTDSSAGVKHRSAQLTLASLGRVVSLGEIPSHWLWGRGCGAFCLRFS